MKKIFGLCAVILLIVTFFYNYNSPPSSSKQPKEETQKETKEITKIVLNEKINRTTNLNKLNTTLNNMNYKIREDEVVMMVLHKNTEIPPLFIYTKNDDIAVYDINNMNAITAAMKILEFEKNIHLTNKEIKKILSMQSQKNTFLTSHGLTFQFFNSSVGNETYSTGIQFYLD